MRAATLFFTLVIVACGSDNNVGVQSPADDGASIVGGYESVPGSRPYQISLQSSTYGHFCGGALISSDWVLTAAHCVSSNLEIRVGVHTLSSNEGQTIAVSQVIAHPGYNSSTMENDIALLKLASPADAAYAPLALPTTTVMADAGAPGDMVIVSGWGATQEGGSTSDTLQEVAVPVVSNTTCNSAYPGDIVDSMVCAGFAEGGKDSCQGDSGGPLVAEYQGSIYSVGVVSWGEGCARPDKYGVYTRTISHLSWIESNLDGGGGGDIVQLENDVPVTNLSAAKSAWLRFAIDVPTGATDFVVQTSGGTGDGDLYVRFGAEPSLSAYDCRPYNSGNNESCSVAAPSAGSHYIFVHGYSAFSGVSLVAAFTIDGGGGGDLTLLESGVPVNGLNGNAGSWRQFAIDVPADTSSLSIDMSGGTGDADLYVRAGSEPTETAYDCRPYKNGNIESCVLTEPAVGRVYVFLRGYTTYANVTLQANISGGGGDPILPSGATVTGLSAAQGDWIFYRVLVPAGATSLHVEIAGGDGDADLYTRAGERPTTSAYDCRPYEYGNNEVCTLSNPAAGEHSIGVRAYTAFGGVALTAIY